VSVLLVCFAGPASAQDIERVRQIDRVCLGRMLIVQTMATVKERGKSEEEYREENPFDRAEACDEGRSKRGDLYVWSHRTAKTSSFGAVMEACYDQNMES
jgi:hypothetical protein